MLYSEEKERENRFAIALKIVFPFFLLIIIFVYAFKLFTHSIPTFILLTLLIPIYVYYIFYLIYNGFRNTLIDSVTKAFTRKQIIKIIEKIKPKKAYQLVLLHVDNIGDINERYGVINGDKVLKNIIVEFNAFLTHQHFKNTPIGRCGGGNFLVMIRHHEKELSHLLTRFQKEMKHKGINDIEVKIDFVIVSADYDHDIAVSIERLYILLEESKKCEAPLNIKPNEFEFIVNEALCQNNIVFKYQPALCLESREINLFEVLPKLQTKEHGMLSKTQIERIVNYGGYEKIFDEKIISLLLDEVKPFLNQKSLISIDISAVTLRNTRFKPFISTLFREKKIDPHHFIFEITEKNSYEDMGRFREILLSYKAMGFKIALGDFGGNNASVEYIKQLPIDIIKFDIEFTKKIDDEIHAKVFQHYIHLAHDLGIQTMAKFIDKEALFDKIKAFNLDFIQGFYISKPKKLEEILV
ncbi:MAG: signal peptide protein [Sulfurovum sp. FS06-10]|nr:MAG: signal peptide protein [Sulfurovum sp. FS06-10]